MNMNNKVSNVVIRILKLTNIDDNKEIITITHRNKVFLSKKFFS
ncbi:hypothetical protein HMPREF0216_01427 [Clostridium celatum DSM 1785]|uniref:Uncharacterized protein n=1 Tax=Clostridium celatum DSM 1785 TaxID=545697 RepID=L1QHA9_9CLOT|nr:hypothetical protein HMPREF0216_01427 [Clostridium celatum DSM 1785]